MPLSSNYFYREALKSTAEGGSLAEEVISTVRTAHAFGTQNVLGELYNAHINNSLHVDMKSSFWQGGGLAVFFFIIYSTYGLGMFKPETRQCLILTGFQQLSASVQHLLVADTVCVGSWSIIFHSVDLSIQHSNSWSCRQRDLSYFNWILFPRPSCPRNAGCVFTFRNL